MPQSVHHLPAGKVHEDFTTWAVSEGQCVIKHLKVAAIEHAGIGIVATDDIKPGEILAFTPSSALLTREDIIPLLPNLPQIRHKNGVKRDLHEIRTHALLAAGLASSVYKDQAPWQKVWPSYESFSAVMPLLWPKERQQLLPPSTLYYLDEQQKRLTADYNQVKEFGFQFDKDEYTYAWIIVNTRTLHYKPKSYQSAHKDDCMAMCPFIDYFNHSDIGCNVRLIPEGATKPKGYQVQSTSNYAAGEQVFVCYGAYNNDKLLCEYGFILDVNKWDDVDISNFVLPRLSTTQKEILRDTGFNEMKFCFDVRSGFCFRSQAALRLSLINLPSGGGERLTRWRQYVSGDLEVTGDEDAVQEICVSILRKLKFQGQEALHKLGDIRKTADTSSMDYLLKKRWRQILTIISTVEMQQNEREE